MNLLTPEERQKTVIVQGLKFVIDFISPKRQILISNRRAQLQGGISIDALTQSDFDLYNAIATVDICSDNLKWPEGFPQSSCEDWDDEDLIFELSKEIYKFATDMKSRLKKNRLSTGSNGQ